MGNLRQIGGADPGPVPAAAGATTGHHGQVPLPATGEEKHLVGHVINGIEDKIKRRCEQRGGGLGIEELLYRQDPAIGIDGADACGHAVNLGAAHSLRGAGD